MLFTMHVTSSVGGSPPALVAAGPFPPALAADLPGALAAGGAAAVDAGAAVALSACMTAALSASCLRSGGWSLSIFGAAARSVTLTTPP